MSPEGQKPSENKLFLEITGIAGIFILSQFAFSGKSRDRAIGRSGNKSEISGVSPEHGETLDVMHKSHKKDKDYDNADTNSIVATIIEHLIYHRVHRGRSEEIGMASEEENESAIKLTQYRAIQQEKKKRWFKAP